MRQLILGIVVLLFISGSNVVLGQNEGEAAPDFTVTLAEGGTWTLSDHIDKVVLLFFFGNNCPYCEDSGPAVQGLYESYMNNEDFVALGLDTFDGSSSTESVNLFATNTGITFPLAVSANSVKTAYGYSHDRLLVIDKEGIIRRKTSNSAGNDVAASSEAIQAALSGTTSVEEISGDKAVALYPNPASDMIYVDINLEDDSDVQVIISDITGKERRNISMNLGSGMQNLNLNTEDLEQGIYLYSVQYKDRVEAGKFLIQR